MIIYSEQTQHQAPLQQKLSDETGLLNEMSDILSTAEMGFRRRQRTKNSLATVLGVINE